MRKTVHLSDSKFKGMILSVILLYLNFILKLNKTVKILNCFILQTLIVKIKM